MTSLPTLCDDAVALVANHLAPCERRVGDGVRCKSELPGVYASVRPLATLGRVCKALRSTMKTHPTLRKFFDSGFFAHVRVVESEDAALVLNSGGMRCLSRAAERTALLEHIMDVSAAQGGLPVRLSVTSARVKGSSGIHFGLGYIAEVHRTRDTEIECGDCSLVEANWVDIKIRCAVTNQYVEMPNQLDCGTLRVESPRSYDRGRISLLFESFDEELLFSVLFLKNKKEAEAWGIDWARWGGTAARLGGRIGPAPKRSRFSMGGLIGSQTNSTLLLSSSP